MQREYGGPSNAAASAAEVGGSNYHLDTRADLPGTEEVHLDRRHKVSLASCSQEVLIQYAQGSGPIAAEAKRRLLVEHGRFINGIIKEAHPYREHDNETWRAEREDAQQGAKLGFLQALERFDLTCGVELGTFAYNFIRRAVLESVYAEIPREGIERRAATLLAFLKTASVVGDRMTLLILLKVVLLDGNKSAASHTIPLAKTISLDVKLEKDPEFERKNFVCSDSGPEFEQIEEELSEEATHAVRDFTHGLPAEKRYIFEQVCVSERTQADVARELGESRAAVNKALRRIRIEGREILAKFERELAA